MPEVSNKGKVLITGVPGQLGQQLYSRIGPEGAYQLTRDHCDLADQKAVLAQVAKCRPSLVVHTAGVSFWKSGEALSPTETQRLRLCNALATDNVAKACAMGGVPLIAISCDSVLSLPFALPSPVVYDETSCVGSFGNYGATKVAAEHALLRLAQFTAPQLWKSGYRYWIIRTSGLYEHPWRFHRNLPTIMRIGTSKTGQKISVPRDVFFSPTYVPHFVDCLITFMENLHVIPAGVYHMRSEGHCSMYEFALRMRSVVKKSPQVEAISAATLGPHLHDTIYYPRAVLGMKKLFKYLGGSIRIPTWEQGVEAYAASIKLHGSPTISNH